MYFRNFLSAINGVSGEVRTYHRCMLYAILAVTLVVVRHAAV